MTSPPSLLTKLRRLHGEKKGAIRARLREFAQVAPGEYFYELVYCLLTPQSSARNAEQTIELLRAVRFAETGVDPEPILRTPSHYIRFHKTKAKHLLAARERFGEVAEMLGNGGSSFTLREWLVGHVSGLGFKESTHFLRNIGKNDGLAILDRHILRNLQRFGVLASPPKSLSKNQYLLVEGQFQTFAEKIGIPLDELDLLFWSMETGEIRK